MIGMLGALRRFDEALEWQLDDPFLDDDEAWVDGSAEEAPTSP